MDITRLLHDHLTPAVAARVAALPGLPPDKAPQLLEAAVAGVLAALLANLGAGRTAAALRRAVDRTDASALDRLPANLGRAAADVAELGVDQAWAVLGRARTDALEAQLAAYGGVPRTAARQVTGIAASFALAGLKRAALEQNRGADAALRLFRTQRCSVAHALPAELAGLLDGPPHAWATPEAPAAPAPGAETAGPPVVHHIPVCPFSQRLEILLELKGIPDAVRFDVVDITGPREPRLAELARGSTALPIMVTGRGVLRESLVILRYLEERHPEPAVARADPYERAVENMMIGLEAGFTAAGYRMVMNQDAGRGEACHGSVREQFAALDDFLRWQSPEGTFLFEDFGLAEVVLTPVLVRFWFLDYYEGFALPPHLDRVARWREACLAHPAAQQVSREAVVKAYYDYARGAGDGALPQGRAVSSFAFAPHWSDRPWPPRDKYGPGASDAALGLL